MGRDKREKETEKRGTEGAKKTGGFSLLVPFIGSLVAVMAVLVFFALRVLMPANRLEFSPNHPSKNPNSLKENEFDFIVVGSGSAGSVIASKLSEKHKVLLLEAGGPDNKAEIHIPAAFGKLFKSESDWNFKTVPQKNLKNRELYWPRGKVFGGSSSMNAMVYNRGNKEDYDEWEKAGNKGWGYKDVLPYFKSIEKNVGDKSKLDVEYHGFDGLWKIGDQIDPHEITGITIDAISETLKIPKISDFNGKSRVGIGYFQKNVDNGVRQSIAHAFLSSEILSKRNTLFVRENAQVKRVLFNEGKRVVGVLYYDANSKSDVQVKAKKEVILCAGSIMSPTILMHSGIGPKQHLEKLGIQVIHDNPNVGENLQDHTFIPVVWNTSALPSLHSNDNPISLLKWISTGRGPLTSNVAEGGGHMVTKYSKDGLPDLEFHIGPCIYVNHGMTVFPGQDGITIGSTPLRVSTGRITIDSNDPFKSPLIDPNYLGSKEEENILIEGIKLSRKVFENPLIRKHIVSELKPGPNVKTDDQILDYIRSEIETLYHPVGTCKMGPESDKTSVVSPELKVRGVQGLRVIDGSIMPTLVRANTNAAIVMIATKASDMIMKEY